jgi:hypothetical protein
LLCSHLHLLPAAVALHQAGHLWMLLLKPSCCMSAEVVIRPLSLACKPECKLQAGIQIS